MIDFRIEVDRLDGLADHLSGVAQEAVDAGVRAATLPLQAAMKEVFGSEGGSVTGQTRTGRNIYQAAPAGSAPGIRSGHLRRSIQATPVTNHEARVGTNLEYGKYLEWGTSKMDPRPWCHKSLRKARPAMEAAAQRAIAQVWDRRAAALVAKAGGAA